MITALELASILKKSGRPLSELAAVMPRLPQVQYNIPASRKAEFATNVRVQEAIKSAQASFTGLGRVVVRPSGTEPKVRVMVEGEKEAEVEAIAQELAAVIAEELG